MREGLIILPQADNSGNSLETLGNDLAASIGRAFGGCTVTEARGIWVDHGEVYDEPVWQFTVAYSPSDENDRQLRRLAQSYGLAAKQLSIYVRLAGGSVEIIDLQELREQAAA